MGTQTLNQASRRRIDTRAALIATLLATTLLAACSSSGDEGKRASSTADIIQKSSDQTIDRSATGQQQRIHGDTQDELRAAAGDRIYFDYDSAVVRGEDVPTLQKAAGWLKTHPGAHIMIEGHADERGTREYNLALGERRAQAMEKALLGLDVAPGQITGTVSYGKERPAVVGSTETSWAQNRRAVMAMQ